METNRICLNQTFTSIILYTGVVYWSCKGRIHTFSVDTARKRCSLKLFKYTWLRNISAYVTQVHTPRLHKRHNCAYVTFAHTSQLRKRHICANITFAHASPYAHAQKAQGSSTGVSWLQLVLIERKEKTAGSNTHLAGRPETLNV